jgi:hypothetical protein
VVDDAVQQQRPILHESQHGISSRVSSALFPRRLDQLADSLFTRRTRVSLVRFSGGSAFRVQFAVDVLRLSAA